MLTHARFSSEGNEQVGSFGNDDMVDKFMVLVVVVVGGSNFNQQMVNESINKKYGW